MQRRTTNVVILTILLFLMLCSSAYAIKVDRNIASAVKPGETVDITITVKLEGEIPSSLIVTEDIPSGWTVESSDPEASPFSGKIKWLLYGTSLKETTTLKYALKAPASFSESQAISGTWKTLSGQGNITGKAVITENKESAQPGTQPPQPGQPPAPGPSPGEEQKQDYTMYAIGAVVIILLAVIVFLLLKKKK